MGIYVRMVADEIWERSGSIPQCPQIKYMNMERTLNSRQYSYAGLFQHIKKGNTLHVSLDCYSASGVQVECTRQNKYAGCDPKNNKYTTSTTEKKGYITIYRRY